MSPQGKVSLHSASQECCQDSSGTIRVSTAPHHCWAPCHHGSSIRNIPFPPVMEPIAVGRGPSPCATLSQHRAPAPRAAEMSFFQPPCCQLLLYPSCHQLQRASGFSPKGTVLAAWGSPAPGLLCQHQPSSSVPNQVCSPLHLLCQGQGKVRQHLQHG